MNCSRNPRITPRRRTSILRALIEASGSKPHTLLELGSGAGNTASHFKRHVQVTLVDLSPRMLALSRRLNPECEHLTGDMRSVRLGRTFDAVFIQDAIAHLTTENELRQALRTAYVHCKPGGVALLAPDFVQDTFTAGDGPGRSRRRPPILSVSGLGMGPKPF